MNPWLLVLVPIVLTAILIPFVQWLVKSTVTDKLEALAKTVDAVDTKHTLSNREQGTRIGDLESENVARKAVDEERRRVREDTRGIPVTEGKGRRER